jgi:hypothetical protein
MTHKILSLILLFVMAVMVTDCTYKPKYACPPGKGIECRPIGEIYDAIREDRVEDMIEECNNPKSDKKNKLKMNSVTKTKAKSKSSCKSGNCGCGCSGKPSPSKNHIKHEKHQNDTRAGKLASKKETSKVWLAPYTNDTGAVIGEHYIEMER